MSPLPQRFFLKFLPVPRIIKIWKTWKYQPWTSTISEFMVFLKNGKLTLGVPRLTFQYYIFFDNPQSWKFIWVCFFTPEIQAQHLNCPKTYWFSYQMQYMSAVYICKKICSTIAEYFVFHYNVSNELKLLSSSLTIFKWSKTIFLKRFLYSAVFLFRFKRSNESLKVKNMSIVMS